ncbi:hypothetical protein BHE74_00044969 [Ensete ventricosum]|nr:hypothetical protein BHE74_00044969 [Ensete ventricosum]
MEAIQERAVTPLQTIRIHPPGTQVNEEVQFQPEIAWDRRIATHQCLNTIADVGLQEHDAPITGATRELHEELQIKTRSHFSNRRLGDGTTQT